MNKTKLIIISSLGIIIYSVVVLSSDKFDGIYKYIAYGLLGLLALVFIVFVLSIKRSKSDIQKLQDLLDNNKYDEALEIINIQLKSNKLNSITQDIMNYYKVLCLLEKDDNITALECCFNVNNKNQYPIVFYYQALLCYGLNKQCDYNDLYVQFLNSQEVKKNSNLYKDYNDLFYVLVLDSSDSVDAKENFNKIVESNYELPISKSVYNKLFEKYGK